MGSTDWPAPNGDESPRSAARRPHKRRRGPGRQNTPLYACHPEAIFVRGPNEPEPFPLLRHRLPEVSRETMSALPSPVMSPTPTTTLYDEPQPEATFARGLKPPEPLPS